MNEDPKVKRRNNISWRHHYNPQFYLRGFTNAEGKFKIFDVESQRFIKDGKEFAPESFFFEKDGNTVVNTSGEADDFIEKHFSELDNRVAGLFNTIRNADTDTRFGVSEEDMPALQHFASVMFWRMPSNYDLIKRLIKEKELSELGMILKSRTTHETIRNEDLANRIKNDPNFYKTLKLILPYVTYDRLLSCRTPLTIQTFPKERPALCSDNPVIFQKSDFPDIYGDDFIFPLSHNIVFIRGKANPQALVQVKVIIDLISLKQAKKYVSCTDERYVEHLNNIYHKHGSSLELMKNMVFGSLLLP